MIARPINYLTFNGKSIADFNAYISGDGTFSSPEVSYEVVEIPGRNGDILLGGNKFKNISVVYSAWILEDFEENIRALRNFLSSTKGYHRLEDTYHPDEYRMGAFVGPLTVSTFDLVAGTFDLEFNCRPQRYLKGGEVQQVFTSNDKIYNPTDFDAKPIIRVYGKGVVTIGEYEVTIASTSEQEHINIDCDNMECFSGTTNCNSLVSMNKLDFPVLHSGNTNITLGEGITEVIIWPRWWIL